MRVQLCETMATKRSSSAKENKQPIDPAPDADLDDFVLAKPGPSKKARFPKPLSEMQMTNLEKGPVVPNTEKSTAWALRTFNDWRNERNKQSATGDICPLDLLEKPEAEKLNFWLSRFVVEARCKDGEPYPARTLYLLLAGLLRYGRSKSKLCPNFMDKSDWCSPSCLGHVNLFPDNYARMVLVFPLNTQPLSLQRKRTYCWTKE